MLRITRRTDADILHLKLEGKLLASWVGEVLEQLPSQDGALSGLRLDLAQVSFIDAAGQALLKGLLSRGATVSNCSGYISELLHVEKP
jgi:ABC-type transporter Mla MlaB component